MITKEHPEWGDTERWLLERLEEVRAALETEESLEQIRMLQGEARAYRAMIAGAEIQRPDDASTTDYHEDD